MAERAILEGQTQPLVYTLRRLGGDPIDLSTASKVRAALTALAGEGPTSTYDSGGAYLTISNATDGEVSLTPSQLKAGVYVLRFLVYWTVANWEPAPPDDSETIKVYAAYGAAA